MGETQLEPKEKVEELHAQLEEAEETLRAIRSGEVDALVVMGPEGEQVFTLQGAEHPYRQLVETISEGAVTLSPDGSILYCNRSFAALLRTPLEQLLGAHVADFISPADAPVFKRLLQHGLSRGGKEELVLAASDGSLVSAYLSIHPLQLGDMRAACMVVTDLTEQKREEQLRIAHEELERRVAERTAELAQTNASLKAEIGERRRAEQERQLLLQQLVTAQEEERRRISRDLHDQLGQQLTALRFNLEVLKGQCAEDLEMCEQIKLTESIARQLDVGVNFLAWDIRPAALDDLGLGAALANFLKEWSKHTSITVEFHKTGLMEERLSPEIETTIYRIAQEALNNVSKYAQVSHVDVILERQGGHAALMVGDDGQGFNPDQVSVTGDRRGLGLISMRERAALVGGTLEIESAPGAGTTIYARLPVSWAKEGAAKR